MSGFAKTMQFSETDEISSISITLEQQISQNNAVASKGARNKGKTGNFYEDISKKLWNYENALNLYFIL